MKENVKHTPGPWYSTTIPGDYGTEKKSIRPCSQTCIEVACIRDTTEESESNARLITAAPDLLAACQEAAGVLALLANMGRLDSRKNPGKLSKPYEKAMSQIQDALRKAEGR